VNGDGSPARRLRLPRVADMVAHEIRNQIVSGEIEDGAILPSHQELESEFGVSGPSIREALRILENEGLITVRRGRSGGAVVHRPSPDRAAFLLGLVLQSQEATVVDLSVAVVEEYAICGAFCARLPDRNTVLVPRLRDILDQEIEALDHEPEKCRQLGREFHRELVIGCGNKTLALVVDTLQTLRWSQETHWAHRMAEHHESLDLDRRRKGLDAHAQIIDVIEAGDPQRAAEVFRRHMEDISLAAAGARGPRIVATELQWGYRSSAEDDG